MDDKTVAVPCADCGDLVYPKTKIEADMLRKYPHDGHWRCEDCATRLRRSAIGAAFDKALHVQRAAR